MPKYDQIFNYITVFISYQFNKLSLIKLLSANLLINSGDKLERAELKNNRHIIFDNQDFLIFSSFSFDKLLNSKYIDIEGIFDEEKQNQASIEALSKRNETIFYNNIKFLLIFFYEEIHLILQ